MEEFLAKHGDSVQCVLSGFDRVVFKGHLPLNWAGGVARFLSQNGVLIKDFGRFVKEIAARIKEHAAEVARKQERPFVWLDRKVRKEELARQIAERDKITSGLVCILTAVEPCRSYKVGYGPGHPVLVPANRKCLCIYYYFLDRKLGLMHVRIQAWLPLTVQVCVNGREWLARQMDRFGKRYRKLDNAFLWLEDPKTAQRLADHFQRQNWPRILERFARLVNPVLKDLLAGQEHHWVTDQAEYATDLLFKDRLSLEHLYRKLLRYATQCLSAEDILKYFGKKLDGRFAGEVLTDSKHSWLGARVKHRVNHNWMKMYDKFGVVLRIETVINHPYAFRVRRWGTRQGVRQKGWYPLCKSVTLLWRYAEIMRSANHRYLQSLVEADDPTKAIRRIRKICEPTSVRRSDGDKSQPRVRRRRGLNPLRFSEQQYFAAVMAGEHVLHGFRNRDLAARLYSRPAANPAEQRRRTATISRWIGLLRAHGLVAKIPRSRRYRPTMQGIALMGAAIYLHQTELPNSTPSLSA